MKRKKGDPEIILINGSSSAGKSTLSKALQDELNHPYLHWGFDDLIYMSARRYWEDAGRPVPQRTSEVSLQGVEMVEIRKPGLPSAVVAHFGPVLRVVVDSMAPVVATLVKSGNSVIFDHVFHDQKMYDDCVHCFAPYDVFTVGVDCSLDVLEERERARGDRVIGRARGLYDVVHSFCTYDVQVDTSNATVEESVKTIKSALQKRRTS